MNKLQTVWRVENGAGLGPYKAGAANYITFCCDCNILSHPGPADEAQPIRDIYYGDETRDYNFGFKSLAAARRWFYKPAARRYLDSKGFWLVKYRVSTRVVGDYQVVFRKDDQHLTAVERRLVSSL